jgi:hypothetical protein
MALVRPIISTRWKVGLLTLSVGVLSRESTSAIPAASRWARRWGPSKFGRHPDDVGYKGRRVDVIGRSIEIGPGEDAVAAIRRYLEQGYTLSARLLARRPAVIIHPPQRAGELFAHSRRSEYRLRTLPKTLRFRRVCERPAGDWAGPSRREALRTDAAHSLVAEIALDCGYPARLAERACGSWESRAVRRPN